MEKAIFSLFVFTLAATLCRQLLPTDKGRGAGHVLQLFFVLATLCLVVRPLFGFFRDPPAELFDALTKEPADLTDQYENILQNAVSSGGEEQLKKGLYDYLEQQHGIRVKDVEIKVEFAEKGRLAAVHIRLGGAGLLKDPRSLEKEISKLLNCHVEVR